MPAIDPVANALVPANSAAADALGAPNYDEFQSDREVWELLQRRPFSVLRVTMPHCAVKRLEDSGFPYDVVHLAYENAGHTLGPPLAPATLNTLYWIQPGSDSEPFALDLGGTPPGVAAARTDLWPQVLAFLQKHTEQQLSP